MINLDKPQGGMAFQRTAGNQIRAVSVWVGVFGFCFWFVFCNLFLFKGSQLQNPGARLSTVRAEQQLRSAVKQSQSVSQTFCSAKCIRMLQGLSECPYLRCIGPSCSECVASSRPRVCLQERARKATGMGRGGER